MTRRLDTDTLVIATHNQGKLTEFKTMIGHHIANVTSAGELGLPEPEETGVTFAENAAIKALAAARASGHPALADDSGLCVEALDGQPGIYTARWGGPTRDFKMAMTRVHEELGQSPNRRAHFVCSLAIAWPDGHVEPVEGICEGEIVWPMRGTNGHGYDPVFQPLGKTRTFAEMTEAEKNEISHRGKAMRALQQMIASA